jgi:cellulose synthase/poly-beta-1,6-N-acetylglucosamine synthase-like glycosyltransferase
MTAFEIWFLFIYLGLMAALSVFAMHRFGLAWAARSLKTPPSTPPERWPTVLVQVPLYNERYVAERVIDAVCRIDYPRELLTIQVLDDSTDGTSALVEGVVERWAKEGLAIEHVRRDNRSQFKAGALANGLNRSTAELVAVFDADFLPGPDTLTRLVPSFADPKVAMVQARWEHLNRGDSWLTEAEAILLDGHFVNEHGGRYARGCFFNFNGTAGLWRRAAIDDAGGWSGATLTEDLELSYRAQLRGWRFVYRPDVTVPGELPEDVQAFKAQQHRWAKGSIETAKILLPRIWSTTSLPLRTRAEATFHLAANLAYPMVIFLTVLMPLAVTIKLELGVVGAMLADAVFLVGATGSLLSFYLLAEKHVGMTRRSLTYLPLVLALGIGMAVNNTRAVIEALIGRRTAFNRTPKLGGRPLTRIDPSYLLTADWQAFVELAFGAYLLGSVAVAAAAGRYIAMPFLILFAGGFLFLGLGSVWRDPPKVASRVRELAMQPVDSTGDA